MSVDFVSWVTIGLLVVINMALGGLVFARNPSARLNKLFLTMVVGVTAWGIASALSDGAESFPVARISSLIAFGSGFFAVSMSYFFSYEFRHSRLPKRFGMHLLLVVILSVLFSTPLVYDLQSLDAYSNGALYGFYIAAIIITLLMAGYNFVSVIRHGKGAQKNHALFILLGIVGTSILAMITNAIIPALVETTQTTRIGPLFTVILVGSIAYTIVRHKLFDVRFAIARALAYVFTLVTIATIYSAIILGVLSRVVKMEYASWLQQFVYIAMAVLLSSTFQPIRHFFDRITNKLFYQDAYEPQVVFNELNSLMVSSLDIKHLLSGGADILTNNIKPSFCTIALQRSRGHYQMFGHAAQELTVETLKGIAEYVRSVGTNIIVVDQIEDASHYELKMRLAENNIGIFLVLMQGPRDSDEALGYIMLGEKKSGSPYSKKDTHTLEGIANGLIVAVQNALHFEEIQQFNATLQGKVEEQTRRYRTANEKLKKLDETKDEFISMASHQLRTPLTSVKGYLSMVLEGDAGPLKPQQEELLKQSYMSSQRMVNLIADLLNLSRLNTGKFVIDAKPTDLRVIVDQEVAQLRESAKAKSITLTWDIPQTFSLVGLDEGKMHQVVMNFIDNAIYYTPEGGTIAVGLTETATAVEFRVKDSGIGVPRALQRHLFTKFYRADNARRMRPDGTGLGIYMAKKVIAAQGGSVIFESEEGKGSTFGFRFSKTRASRPDPEQTEQPEQP